MLAVSVLQLAAETLSSVSHYVSVGDDRCSSNGRVSSNRSSGRICYGSYWFGTFAMTLLILPILYCGPWFAPDSSTRDISRKVHNIHLYVDLILVSAVAPQINFFKAKPYDSYSYEDSAMIDGGIYD
jgi:hypothetical protein